MTGPPIYGTPAWEAAVIAEHAAPPEPRPAGTVPAYVADGYRSRALELRAQYEAAAAHLARLRAALRVDDDDTAIAAALAIIEAAKPEPKRRPGRPRKP